MVWSVSLVSWGPPSDQTTFSGFASRLYNELGRSGHLRQGFDAKAVSPVDAFRGAISFEPISRLESPNVSRKWMWSEPGCELLSQRLNEKISESGDAGPFLEVGTLTRIDPEFGAHYQIIDMTIAQARAAGRFGFDRFYPKDVQIAEAVQRENLSRAKHVFAFSEWARQSVIRDCGVPAERISVLYTGPNFEAQDFAPRPRKAQRILFMGYDWERKGGPQLLEAFRIVRKRLPRAELYIVGHGPRAEEPGVTLAGTFDRRTPDGLEQIISAYSEASCMCLPSQFDPFPIAIVDAMTFGTPVVAFDNGSRNEAVIDGVTGRLAPEGDIDALADALVSILSDPDLRDAMSAEAVKRSRALFTWKRVVERIGEVVARDSGAVSAQDSGAAASVAWARQSH